MNPTGPAIPRREKAFDIPPLVLAAVALLVAVHGIRTVLPDDIDIQVLLRGAFIPAPWSVASGYAGPAEVIEAVRAASEPSAVAPRMTLARYVLAIGAEPWSPLTYAALHGSWTHVGLNSIWLVAFATSVVRRAGAGRSALLSVATALAGAFAQWLSDPLGVGPMIGASAVLSGFMAAAATFMFDRQDPVDGEPAPSRWRFLRTRGALGFLGAWFAANILFGALATPFGLSDGAIAWQAHIGGLLAGLVLFPLLDPAHRRMLA